MRNRARFFVAALCAGACALGVTLTALSCSGPERRLPELPDLDHPVVSDQEPVVVAPAMIVLDAGTLVDVPMPLDALP